MMNNAIPFGMSMTAGFFVVASILCIIRFRQKVRLIRSLSNDRQSDVYVPYNMLIYGVSNLHYSLSVFGYKWPNGLAYPYDEKNEAVAREIRGSWVISLLTILTTWFAMSIGLFTLILHFNS